MSHQQIENKVVQMEFENSKFDSRINASKKTLEEFDKSLEKSFNPESFARMEESLDRISKRFSTFGIAGMTVIQNLTTSAMNAVSNFEKQVEATIKTGGLNRSKNIEQAKFQIEGLGMTWNEVFGAINYAVSGTAYSLDAAALAASNLAASGVKINDVVGTINDVDLAAENGSKNLSSMGQALGAISGVAAMTNSDFASIASIFSTVAGQGKLMTMQLRQLENRGMNAAAKIAESLGTTEQNVREMVTRGEIDFNTFSETMYKAYYKHAKDANRTMTGILANIKSAWAKIGANFYTPLIQNDGVLVEMLQNYKKKIDEFKVATLPVVETLTELSKVDIQFADTVINGISFEKLGTKINKTFGDGVLTFKAYNTTIEKLGPTAKTTFEKYLLEEFRSANKDADTLIEKYGSLTAAIQAGVVPFSAFKNALKKVWEAFDKVTKPVEATTKALEDYQKVVDEVINGKWGHMEKRWEALTEAGYNWVVVQNMVNEQLGSSVRHSEDLSEAELKNAGYTEEEIAVFKDFQKQMESSNMTMEEYIASLQAPSGKDLLVDSLKNIIETLKILASAVSTAWKAIFNNNTTDSLYHIIESIHNFTEAMRETAEGAKNEWTRSFQGLFAAFDLLFYVIKNVASFGIKVFKAVLEGLNLDVLSFTARIGDAIVAVDKWVRSNKPLEKVISGISKVISGIVTIISSFIKAIKNSGVMKSLAPVGEFFKGLFGLLKVGFESVGGPLETFIEYLKSLDNISFDDIISGFKKLGKGIKDGLKQGTDAIDATTNSFFDFVVSIPKKLKNFDIVSGIGEFIRSIIEQVQETINALDLGPIISAIFVVLNIKLLKKIDDLGASIKDSIGGMFKSIGAGLDSFLTMAGSALLQYGKAEKWKAIGETIKSITGMLLVLAGAVIVLGLLPEAQLKQGLEAIKQLAFIITALIGVSTVASKFGNLSSGLLGIDIGVNGVAETILAFAAAVGVIVLAISKLDKVIGQSKNWETTLAVITGIILAIFTALAISYNMSKSNNFANTVIQLKGVIEFTAAIYILVLAIDKMAKIIEKRGWAVLGALGVITVLIAEMIAVMFIATAAGGPAVTGSIALLPVALFLITMTGVIGILGMLPASVMETGLERVSQISALIVAILGIFAIANAMTGEAIKAGGTLAGIALIIAAMSVSIVLLSKLKLGPALKGLAAMAAVIFGVHVILKDVAKMENGVKNAKGTMLGIAIVIAVIAGSLVALSMIDADKLIMPMIAMGVLMGMLSLLLKQVAEMTKSKVDSGNIKGILTMMAALIAIVAGALVALAIVDNPTATIAAAASISLVLLAMAGVFKIITDSKRYSKDSGPFKNMMKQLTLLAGIMLLVAGALFALTANGQTPEQLIGAAASISLVLLALTGCFAIISKIGDTKVDITSVALVFGSLIIVTGLIAVILGLMANYIDDTNKAIESAEALSLVLLSFAGIFTVFALLSKLKINPKDVAMVAAGFDAVVLVITALFLVLGAIEELTKGGFSNIIDKGIAILDKVSKGLGQAITNLINGFLDPIKEFCKVLGDLPEKAVDGIHYVAELLLAITATSIVGALNTIFGFNDDIFEKFGDHLSKLGKGLKDYVEVVRTMSDADYEAVAKTAEPLSVLVGVLNSLPRTGGVMQWLLGEKDLGGFATNISSLAEGLNTYVTTIRSQNDSDYDAIKKSAEALKALVEVADALPTSGGAFDWLFGKKDLGDFAKGLPNVSNGIVKFYEGDGDLAGVKDIPDSAYEGIESSITAIDSLTKIAKKVPNDWDSLSTIKNFSKGIVNLSDGIYKFYNGDSSQGLHGTKDLGTDEAVWSTIKSAAKAVESLGTVAAKLNESSSSIKPLAEKGSPVDSFKSFGENLAYVSNGLYEFVYGNEKLEGTKKLESNDYTTINNASAVLDSLIDLVLKFTTEDAQKALASLGDGDNVTTAMANLVTFSENLGIGISAFYNNLTAYKVDSIGNINATKFDADVITNAAKAANDIVTAVSKAILIPDLTKAGAFTEGCKNVADGVAYFASVCAENESNLLGLSRISYQLDTIFETLSGLEGNDYVDWTAFQSAMQNMPIDAIDGFIKAWDAQTGRDKKTATQAVKDFFDEVADAGDKGVKKLEDKNYGSTISKAIKKDGDNSLVWSTLYTEFYKTGKFIAEGFGNGLIDSTTLQTVYNNAGKLGDKALSGLKNSLDSHSPSREGFKIGLDTMYGYNNGLTQGIKQMGTSVANATANVAAEGVSYFKTANEQINSILAEGIDDLSPTIRPVLDTSNISAGVSKINSLMSGSGYLKARATVTENLVATYRDSNVSNRDVVDAITDLKHTAGSMRPNNTYTIGNVTYDESSSVASAIETLVHASVIERRA